MGKKKKNKKIKKTQKSIMLLSEIDETLNGKYATLQEEIEAIQKKLLREDEKAIRKERLKLIRSEMGVIPYYVSKERVKIREKALKEMERTNMLGRIEDMFKSFVPCLILIARLVAALIVALLSFTPFQRIISPGLLNRLNSIYKFAISVQ
jgi:hypothetical protein